MSSSRLVSLVLRPSQVSSSLSSCTPGSGGYDLAGGKSDLCKQGQQGQRDAFSSSKSAMVVTIFIVNVSHCCPYPSLMSAIVTAVSVADISHLRGLSVVDIGHRRGCHRRRRRPSSRLSPSLTWAISVAIAVINIDAGTCNHIVLLSMRCAHSSQINSNKYCFSSFNNVDLFCSMSADCCMPWFWGWGTMAAVGQRQRRPPWSAGACILSSFS